MRYGVTGREVYMEIWWDWEGSGQIEIWWDWEGSGQKDMVGLGGEWTERYGGTGQRDMVGLGGEWT